MLHVNLIREHRARGTYDHVLVLCFDRHWLGGRGIGGCGCLFYVSVVLRLPEYTAHHYQGYSIVMSKRQRQRTSWRSDTGSGDGRGSSGRLRNDPPTDCLDHLLADHNNIVRYPVMSVSKEDIIQIALREHEDTSGLSDRPVTFAHAHIVYRHTAG